MIYTFQTVKMSLDTWRLVQHVMDEEDKSLSEALELLVRHGAIRHDEIVKSQTALEA